MFKKTAPKPDGLNKEQLTELVVDADNSISNISMVLDQMIYDGRKLPNHRSQVRHNYIYFNETTTNFGEVVMFERSVGGFSLAITTWRGTRDHEPAVEWGISNDGLTEFTGALQIRHDGFEEITSSAVALQRFIVLGGLSRALLTNPEI